MKRKNITAQEPTVLKRSRCSSSESEIIMNPSPLQPHQQSNKQPENTQKINESKLMSVLMNSPTSPNDVLLRIMKAKQVDVNAIVESTKQDKFYIEHTEEQISLYSQDVISAIRSRDVTTLRSMHEGGRDLQSCNRFGESLVHMACRRGFLDVVKCLTEDADVSIRVKDDYGRNPLHDACWSCEPNFALMDHLIDQCVELLFVTDKRGHAPLQYTRREHWKYWNAYLLSRAKSIIDKVSSSMKKN